MKDILLETDYDEQAIVVLVDFCRKIFQGNEYELKIIDEFGRDYHKHTPIWWYTRECFTYKMLNRSLRMLEIDVIAAMGFFMKDIHQQLEKEHRTRSTGRAPFIVYRGQAMSNDEFEKIHKNINGLLTFNNLLSTSVDFKVAMGFAQNRKGQPDKVPILFEMQIDPILTTIPFASLKGLGYFHAEEEILFSMHTIFRITQVKENQDHIWQIKLDLVSDKDLQIGELIKRMRSEIGDGSATDRLARLMVTFGEFGKAETVYNLVLGSIPNDDEKALACIYNQLGYTQYKQGNHSQALTSYEDALKIQEKLRPSTDLDLANTYNNIGLLYANPNDSCKAVEYHQKALNIQQEHLDHNHPDLANTYNNLGLAQISMGDHKHGLDNLSAALRIRQISLPANHPLIASVYSTIGGVYQKLEDYSNALIFYKNALDIEEQASHSNHQTLAMAYYNMSTILNDLKQNDKAIQYAESAVQLASKFLEPNHPNTILFNEYFKELKTKQS
ncbi:unnamed protein product [Rotaria sp. Silwood1]|nr:unnamed protein product [Rotaria sp. Silwood1]CAF0885360.1 unnamed protein product [Rotaria sp. Silwood1]CAF0899270.1 unnamed protein product [Rotaria sp. Silwood1]CAF3349163.1 unnamed protein product [Rotaria sp. Silwood1]CAF3372326.1 unnamed protein product [Rotaria sp. Silwood1]